MSSVSQHEKQLSMLGRLEIDGWNRKMCWEARDTLFACVDQHENKNKFRCPDELYAYEQWCPADFRRVASYKKRREEREMLDFDPDWIQRNNISKQSIL